VKLASPIFWNFSSTNSLRWKYGLNYTLTNGTGEAGQDGQPPAHPKVQNPLFWKNIPEIRVQLARLANSGVPGRTHRNQKKKSPFSAAELKEKGLVKV
jgi:hypothetical protein